MCFFFLSTLTFAFFSYALHLFIFHVMCTYHLHYEHASSTILAIPCWYTHFIIYLSNTSAEWNKLTSNYYIMLHINFKVYGKQAAEHTICYNMRSHTTSFIICVCMYLDGMSNDMTTTETKLTNINRTTRQTMNMHMANIFLHIHELCVVYEWVRKIISLAQRQTIECNIAI